MKNKTKFLLISALSLCTLSAGVTAVMAGAETETSNELNLTFAGASIRYAEEGKQDGIRFAIEMDTQDWNDFSEQIEETYVKINNGTKWGDKILTSDNWYPVDEKGKYAEENAVAYRSVVVLYGDFDATMDFKVQAFAKFYDEAEEVSSAVSDGRSMSYVAKEEVKNDSSKLDAVKEYIYYTVTVKVDGATLVEQPVPYGTGVGMLSQLPVPEKEGYTFAGWVFEDGSEIPADATVTSDVTVKAAWNVNTYTVTWKNADGSTLETDEDVVYGTTPTYDGETPVQEVENRTYVFNGWDKEIVAVTGETTYTATYYSTVSSVTEFMNMDTSETAVVKQVADIDFEGAAITPVAVNGVYDGQGFALTNFVSKNVFGSVSGTVKNIKVQGTIICPADAIASGIVEQLSGTIENVYAELTASITGMSSGWAGFTRGMVAGLVFDGYTARNIVAIVDETANTYNYGLFSIDADRVTNGNTTTMNNVYFYAKGNAYYKAVDFPAKYLFNYNLYTEEVAFANAVNAAIDAGTLPESFRITPTVWVEISTAEQFLAMEADGNYRQTADIDFEGAAITPVAVNGVYDGQGFALTNFVSKNVFGNVTGTVKNIKVQGTIICPADQHSSGIVQQLSGTIENVYAELTADVRGMSSGWAGFTRGMVAGLVFDGYTARNIVAIVDETANTYNYGLFSIDADRVTNGNTTTMNNVYFYAKGNAYYKAVDFPAKYLFNYNLYTEEVAFANAVNAAIDAGTLPESFRITPTVWTEISTAEQFLAMDPNGFYKQTAPIDFGGAAINLASFAGVYDGQGFAITNFVTKNVIGSLTGTFKNVKLQGKLTLSASETSAGVIAGISAGAVLENIYVDVETDFANFASGWVPYTRSGLIGYAGNAAWTVRNIVMNVEQIGQRLLVFTMNNDDSFTNATIENLYYYVNGSIDGVGGTNFDKSVTNLNGYNSESALVTAVNAKVDAGELPEMFRMELTEDTIVWTEISTAEQFMAMDPNGFYKQTAPIDLSGVAFTPVAVNGVYDGQGYAITGFVGKNLFGSVSGTVKNIKVQGTITCAVDQHSSGIVHVLAGGTLENVYAEIKVNIEGFNGWPYFLRGLVAGQLASGYTARNIVLVVDDSESPLGYSYFSMDGDNPVDASTVTMENIFVYGGTQNLDFQAGWKEYCFDYTEFTSEDELKAAVQAKVEAGEMPEMFKAE